MILIALGANLPGPAGEPASTLNHALRQLNDKGVKIRRVSSFYETPAWPDPADPIFVNAVALLETVLQPVELLALLHDVETELGRMRSRPNAPRTLDLDLLDFNGQVMEQGLILPHPRMAERSFVLVPLAEIAPDWRHPVSGKGVEELLAALPDRDAPRSL
ncbi:MAG TPA: 2-amino-4-hydroxy-6-hydroxymethyldihydropteridine diphosphokinase [Rhizomicrobium sp.]|jgi:2-amino-4-hydroxy-6-hydroxymethyldihydropteridine diphosphokinase